MDKQQLRLLYLERRNKLSPCELEELSERINFKLREWFYKLKPNRIHTFIPMPKEPNLMPFLNEVLQTDTTLFVPVVVGKGQLKNSHHSQDMVLGKFGTRQPRNPIWYEGEFDWVIVPLLCFDKSGFRVGYGGGYYDRMLSTSKALKIGVSLFEPIERIADIEPFDIRLDMCLTPTEALSFQTI